MLGRTGLTVSRLGFGGYRVDDETPEHREALVAALTAGCSLIDTSTNYTDGGSERLVGAVLAELGRDGRLNRDAVVVVSKIGYVQGQNLVLAQEREAAGKPFPEMVKYMEGCWHCLHPEFLRDQLARSLDRLQLSTLDVCLLHNPEYFLSDAMKRAAGGELEEIRKEFYRRLRLAFAFLETQVAAGRLACYGVSSNTAVARPDDPEATSLSLMLEAATAAGGPAHHFRVLQVPANLFESGAILQPNTGPGGSRTVLGVAAEAGIAVLMNRPLNAIAGEGMIRLADVPAQEAGGEPPEDALRRLSGLEAEFRAQIAPHLRVPQGAARPAEWFRWADQLRTLPAQVRGLDHWQQIEGGIIGPAVTQVVGMLDQGLAGPMEAAWQGWRNRYLPELEATLAAFRGRAARQSQTLSERVAAAINPYLPLARTGESLSRKALWVLASTPGVTSVLLGMRRPVYVTDAMAILGWPPLPDVRPIYEAIRRQPTF
jgi:aryl-alcohol dehydrogenase-like predicted oxidoreductase